MNERIRLIRKKENLSQPKFGEKLGVSRDVINNLELGRVEPKPLIINHICTTFNINKKWLLTGNGEMYEIPEKDHELSEALANISTSNNEDIKKIVMNLNKLNDRYLNIVEQLIDELSKK